jgi:hypothetical protein
MQLGKTLAAFGVGLAPLVVTACGSAPGDDLFSPGGSRIRGTGGGFYASGGSFGTGGFTSIVPPTGGAAGFPVLPTGGTPGAGGSSFPPPPAGGAGGMQSGGATSAGGAVVGGGGATGNPLGCNFDGTWGSYIQVPVSWPATPLVLQAGTGFLQQWNLTSFKQDGLNVNADTVPCSIYLPDLQSDFFGGYSKFGIRFPDSLFDAGAVQHTKFVLFGEVSPTGYNYHTDPFAILLGIRIDSPTTTPWPAVGSQHIVDDDLDGKMGITVVPAPGNGYSLPPTDLSGGRADLIYIAERTVSFLAGSITACDKITGSVTITSINNKPSIDSSVIGCRKVGGVECVANDAAFIDANRPQYTPTSLGTITTVRMPSGTTCADVRKQFPVQ